MADMRDDSIAKLVVLCGSETPQHVQVHRYEDSYTVTLGCRGKFGFRLRSRTTDIARHFDSAADLYDGLVAAFADMGEPHPAKELRTSILYMVPDEPA